MLQAENYKAADSAALLEPEGRVEACFQCGRPGVECWTEEGLLCVHEEALEMMSDGLLVTPIDACLLESHPFAVSHSELI